MKKLIKYLISTAIFGFVYTLVLYLFTKSIDWKMIVITIIIYVFLYFVIDLVWSKFMVNKK